MPGAREVFCVADNQIVVYPSIVAVYKFFIMDNVLTCSVLLQRPATSHTHRARLAVQSPLYALNISAPERALAILRLAITDYRRFYFPISGTLVHGCVDTLGTYYTMKL